MTKRADCLVLALSLLAAPGAARARNGAYDSTAHGNPTTGVQRIPSEPRGECSQCHSEHASSGGVSTGGPYPYALFAQDDNLLCFGCHSLATAIGGYQGDAVYGQSLHATAPGAVWPGPTPPARPLSDGGKCVNCHQPHGLKDAAGVVPSLLFAREEAVCLPCHDGSPAIANVAAQFQLKAYRHPLEIAGRHAAAEGASPQAFAAAPVNNRHSECTDCHNPHFARADPVPPVAPAARSGIVGVTRVRVNNGAAGSVPIFTPLPATDTTFVQEYEVCFKCHSSWTTQPIGQSDLSLLLNPANPSFHPVEGPGKNPTVNPNAFASGWSAASTTWCSDCHASDDPLVRGPHGSAFRYLLKKNSSTSTAGGQVPSAADLCFDCHLFDTYANPNNPNANAYSRFNPPNAAQGHAYHVGSQGYACYACHQSHGSTAYPALMVTGRSPGLLGYTATATGGTCAPTCHGTQSYQSNYPR